MLSRDSYGLKMCLDEGACALWPRLCPGIGNQDGRQPQVTLGTTDGVMKSGRYWPGTTPSGLNYRR